MALLDVRDLETRLYLEEGVATPVDRVSLFVESAEAVALVGESGSGKSLTARSILGLLPREARVVGGRVLFDGIDLLTAPDAVMDQIRGGDLSTVFQDPLTFLNPVMRVGDQVAESLLVHGKHKSKRAARASAVDLLDEVGIGDSAHVARGYPHQLSGGMRQRVLLAIALASRPRLLIADEPFTALDLSTQEQLIELIRARQRELGFSVMLITHDWSVTARLCDRLYVMYAGRIIETGRMTDVASDPKHPYTRGLIQAVRLVDSSKSDFSYIPGSVPSLLDPPSGCRFHPRCPMKFEPCAELEPDELIIGEQARVRCWLHA